MPYVFSCSTVLNLLVQQSIHSIEVLPSAQAAGVQAIIAAAGRPLMVLQQQMAHNNNTSMLFCNVSIHKS